MASSLEKLVDSHPVSVYWRSFELRPKGTPLPPEYLARIQMGRPRLYAIARERYGLEMNPGPFGFDSRPAMIGAKVAESMGCGPAYHDRVMRAYWQEGRDIGDRTVLANVAADVGLDRQMFLEALDSPAYQQAVLADIVQAQAYGINAVPSLIFADKYLVAGAQPYPVLVGAVEQIQAEQKAN